MPGKGEIVLICKSLMYGRSCEAHHPGFRSSIYHFTCRNQRFETEKTASQIAKSIIDLHNSLKTGNNNIAISLIMPRCDKFENKANEVNNRLINMCNQRNIEFINHSDDHPTRTAFE